METRASILRPLVGSGSGDQSRVLRFKPEIIQSGEVALIKAAADAGSVLSILKDGVYSVSAAMRFQCLNGQDQPISNGWGITVNSLEQGQRNVIDIPPPYCLAKAVLAEPGPAEAQREPMVTLLWVGFLRSGSELRVESERPGPRLYQGIAEDPNCFLRVERLWGPA